MKRLSCMICVILLISMLALPVAAQTHGEAYDALSSEAYQEAYRLLEEGIAGMAPVIYIPVELEISYLELLDIARAVCLDHPEYFWFLESWFYEYNTEDGRYLVDKVTPTYYLDHERVSAGSQALADAMIAFHSKVNEIITGIPVNCTSDYDIALYLHDYLAENVTYTLDGDHDSAYAALIHGEAACYGYSKAYQYLLSQAGIRSRIIVGDSLDADGGKYGHAWNQVWIDCKCYYVDVTWDDLDFGTIHQYFLVSLDMISVDHVADELFLLPACGHSLDYYQVSAGNGAATFTDDTTGETAAAYFRLLSNEKHEAVFTCEVRYNADMDAWFDDHAWDLANVLDLSYKAEISYYTLGDVYYLILTDPLYVPSYKEAISISLNMTEVALKGVGAQAQLDAQITPFEAGILTPVFSSDDASVVVVSSSGMITAVGAGTATITVSSADGTISAQCVVTVEEGEPHTHEMRLIGASDPTCTLDGNDAYYLCTGCFHRFADGEASVELTDVSTYSRLPTGHVDLSWEARKSKNSHQQVCSCGELIPQTVKPHEDADEDGSCDLCHKQMNTNAQDQSGNEAEQGGIDFRIILAIIIGIVIVGVVIFL